MNNIIKAYVDNMTIADLNNFALKNNIHLTREEANCLYHTIKTRSHEILVNGDEVLNDIKGVLSPVNYQIIKILLAEYRQKYKGYIN